MAKQNRLVLKGKWITGYKPKSIDYADLFDSFYNTIDDARLDSITIEGDGTKVLTDNGVYVDRNLHNHSISAITNLQNTLDSKQPSGSYATISSLSTTAGELVEMISLKQDAGDYITENFFNSAISAFNNDRLTSIISQPHSFIVGDIISKTNIGYSLSQYGISENVVGIVTNVIDSNKFEITTYGFIEGLTNVTPGVLHYLSTNPSSAGKYTTIKPSSEEIIKPIMIGESSTTAFFVNYDLQNNSNYVFNGGGTPKITTADSDSELGVINIGDIWIDTSQEYVNTTAEVISFKSTVSISATNVQTAIEEVESSIYDKVTNIFSNGTFPATSITIITPEVSSNNIFDSTIELYNNNIKTYNHIPYKEIELYYDTIYPPITNKRRYMSEDMTISGIKINLEVAPSGSPVSGTLFKTAPSALPVEFAYFYIDVDTTDAFIIFMDDIILETEYISLVIDSSDISNIAKGLSILIYGTKIVQ